MAIAAAGPVSAQDGAAPSIQLASAPARWREAIVSAAEHAATLGRDWLGAHPTGVITAVAIDPPVWQGRGAMIVERQAAAAVIRSWWPATLADRRADAMLNGFAWYLQGQAVERLFDRRHLRTAHSVEVVHALGDRVMWSVPTLRLSRWTAGIGRGNDVNRGSSRYAAMFATLERWLGAPVLQGAMYEVARLSADRLNGATVVATINDATGQDLSWLFTAVADSSVTFDYAAAELSSTPAGAVCASPCFDTAVTVRRLGDGQFTGRSSSRAGAFESGDAMAVRITFANGDHAWAKWDGRDHSRTFRFQGPSAATAAHLDPDRILVLDANYLNNAIVPASPTNAPMRKWMARWMAWMQNTALSYGFFA